MVASGTGWDAIGGLLRRTHLDAELGEDGSDGLGSFFAIERAVPGSCEGAEELFEFRGSDSEHPGLRVAGANELVLRAAWNDDGFSGFSGPGNESSIFLECPLDLSFDEVKRFDPLVRVQSVRTTLWLDDKLEHAVIVACCLAGHENVYLVVAKKADGPVFFSRDCHCQSPFEVPWLFACSCASSVSIAHTTAACALEALTPDSSCIAIHALELHR